MKYKAFNYAGSADINALNKLFEEGYSINNTVVFSGDVLLILVHYEGDRLEVRPMDDSDTFKLTDAPPEKKTRKKRGPNKKKVTVEDNVPTDIEVGDSSVTTSE